MPKFFLGINLYEFYRLSPELSIKHAVILDDIRDWCVKYGDRKEDNQITVDDVLAQWIDCQTLADNTPLLQLKSVASISLIIKDLEIEKYIKVIRHHQQKLYFQLLEKTEKLYRKKK